MGCCESADADRTSATSGAMHGWAEAGGEMRKQERGYLCKHPRQWVRLLDPVLDTNPHGGEWQRW